jgi:hypothetical protein
MTSTALTKNDLIRKYTEVLDIYREAVANTDRISRSTDVLFRYLIAYHISEMHSLQTIDIERMTESLSRLAISQFPELKEVLHSNPLQAESDLSNFPQ